MSWWQRSQASDSMKNFDGILRLPATCDELGKNGPSFPSPSLFIETGAIDGFRITKRLLQESREYLAPNATRHAKAIIPSAGTQALRFDPLRRRLSHHPASSATAGANPARGKRSIWKGGGTPP